jgi:hypothetical protein
VRKVRKMAIFILCFGYICVNLYMNIVYIFDHPIKINNTLD